jgi:hypothetical protein
VTLQGAIDDQGSGIGIQRDRTGIAPSGDAFALDDFRTFRCLKPAENSRQSMAGRAPGLLKTLL